METKDLIVIGGGINGAGIAADAAGRGLSVLLLEAQDLAWAQKKASRAFVIVLPLTWEVRQGQRQRLWSTQDRAGRLGTTAAPTLPQDL